jgi:short subunit dehydrogenase-like uncharacterized protein
VRITTLMDMPPMVARGVAAAPALSIAMRLPGARGLVERTIRRLPAGPDDEQRASQEFVIMAEVDPGRGHREGVAVRGADPYGLTGEILARTAARLVRGEQRASGVLAPSEAFDPAATLDSLADLAVSWERISGL